MTLTCRKPAKDFALLFKLKKKIKAFLFKQFSVNRRRAHTCREVHTLHAQLIPCATVARRHHGGVSTETLVWPKSHSLHWAHSLYRMVLGIWQVGNVTAPSGKVYHSPKDALGSMYSSKTLHCFFPIAFQWLSMSHKSYVTSPLFVFPFLSTPSPRHPNALSKRLPSEKALLPDLHTAGSFLP